MRNPFRRRRPLYQATAAEVATFGRRITQMYMGAGSRARVACMSDADLEREYAAEVDRTTRRIVAVLEQQKGGVDGAAQGA